jgi:hypothetical protein
VRGDVSLAADAHRTRRVPEFVHGHTRRTAGQLHAVQQRLRQPLAIRFGRFSDDNPALPQRMFIANQDGRLMFSEQTSLKNGPLTVMIDFAAEIGTTINRASPYSEAGFVGMTLHPLFATNGRFYVFYSAPRPDGNNASNTPNCSFTGGYGPSGPSDNRRDFGVDRPYVDDVYTDLTVLEEYQQLSSTATAPLFLRRILTVKHFFTNHYGINNLMFEENGKLLLAVGDGGCFFDQYAVAQNRSFIAGKIVSVDVDSNALYAPPVNCTTPVVLWSELQAACAITYKIVTLYASGVRNFGHMSMDVYQGKINRYVTMVGQNRAEATYRFAWESNFGWYRRENRLCSCVYDDPLIDPQCDFRQTLEQCRNETSLTGSYTYPLVTLNQPNDHVSSNAGAFVYRGNQLPCALRGSYLWGDWSTKDVFTPGFPAPFNGTLQLFFTTPDINGLNTNQVQQENSHGRIRVGGGLLYTRNYLASWGLDPETNRIYMGVQDIIPPYYNGSRVSDRGQIYILTSPLVLARHVDTDSCRDAEQCCSTVKSMSAGMLALEILGVLLLLGLIWYLYQAVQRGRRVRRA